MTAGVCWLREQPTLLERWHGLPRRPSRPTPRSINLCRAVVDFDWSNAKEIWAKNQPMNDEEMLFQQVQMTVAASPATTVWVYRCSVYG